MKRGDKRFGVNRKHAYPLEPRKASTGVTWPGKINCCCKFVRIAQPALPPKTSNLVVQYSIAKTRRCSRSTACPPTVLFRVKVVLCRMHCASVSWLKMCSAVCAIGLKAGLLHATATLVDSDVTCLLCPTQPAEKKHEATRDMLHSTQRLLGAPKAVTHTMIS